MSKWANPGSTPPRPAHRPPPTRAICRRIHSARSEEHTSELQSRPHLVCRLLLEKKKKKTRTRAPKKTTNINHHRKLNDTHIDVTTPHDYHQLDTHQHYALTPAQRLSADELNTRP